jgi:ATP-dependent Lhr-like helicase
VSAKKAIVDDIEQEFAAAQTPRQAVDAWFAERQWKVFPFQKAVWRAVLKGESGLLHATTGSGKTYAVWLGALQRAMQQDKKSKRKKSGLRVLWITPMRALAADTTRALEAPLPSLLPSWSIGTRTGDTTSSERARQTKSLPPVLVTTPESLTLLLSKTDAIDQFKSLDTVIVDEWHELMGSKRGAQTQLALARLRKWNPQLVVWGLSATLGNLRQAQDALLGVDQGTLVEGEI